jgi:aspartate ammonia-lyase
MRTEKDFIGEFQLPKGVSYGINTGRAFENFGDFGERTDPLFIRAYLFVKKAAALANFEAGFLTEEKADMITGAADYLLETGEFGDVIVNPLSGGAGTSLNMNINEVIANTALKLAGERPGDYSVLNPVDDVNMHQSTNDTYPTAFKIAVMWHLNALEKLLVAMQDTLQQKEKEFSNMVKLGRTEMMDALPVTIGMQFSAYAEAIGRDRWRIFKCSERIKTLNIGGTAIGTGFNAPQKYIFSVIQKLKELSGLNISRAENLVDSTQNLDQVVEVSGIIKAMAVNLMKISEDLRLMGSGPEGGLSEFILPVVQEGSSIMPGKSNPVIPEFVSQIAQLVIGNDMVIAGAAGRGNLELNQYYPLASTLMLKNLLMLCQAVLSLNDKCLRGIIVNEKRVSKNLSASVAMLTYLGRTIGHEKAAELYDRYRNGERDIRKLVVESGAMPGTDFDTLTTPDKIRMMGFK